jgi:hypothetical protein
LFEGFLSGTLGHIPEFLLERLRPEGNLGVKSSPVFLVSIAQELNAPLPIRCADRGYQISDG